VHDTCGVHNLHGMPGVLGAICGAISAAAAGDSAYGQDISTIWAARAADGDNRSAGEQAAFQLLALIITLAFSILGGMLTGLVVNLMRGSVDAPLHYFHDGEYWEGVCDLEGAPSSLALPDGVQPVGGSATVYAMEEDKKFDAPGHVVCKSPKVPDEQTATEALPGMGDAAVEP